MLSHKLQIPGKPCCAVLSWAAVPRWCLLPPGSLALRVLPSLISKPPKSTEYLQALPFSPQEKKNLTHPNSSPSPKINIFLSPSQPVCRWGTAKGPECPWGGLARDDTAAVPWPSQMGQCMVSTGFIGWHQTGLHEKFSTASPFGDVLENIKKIISA